MELHKSITVPTSSASDQEAGVCILRPTIIPVEKLDFKKILFFNFRKNPFQRLI